MEEIYIGLYKDSGSNKGQVFFITADQVLGPRQLPSAPSRLTFEEVKDQLVVDFKRRNRKLKVTGMP